ncbi:hypothetical protein L484_025866 [Morus notabilis]|uniref:Uncharacterized protein n=1 Tax=Morus notabilis TaxID=981085 RepID=W9RD50_9ROSA|nr:hypothetical protein L484_025866 [Morus notabilis]
MSILALKEWRTLNDPKKHVQMPNLEMRVLYLRAALEGLLEKHFGVEIMNELFQRFSNKVAESSFFLDPENQKCLLFYLSSLSATQIISLLRLRSFYRFKFLILDFYSKKFSENVTFNFFCYSKKF